MASCRDCGAGTAAHPRPSIALHGPAHAVTAWVRIPQSFLDPSHNHQTKQIWHGWNVPVLPSRRARSVPRAWRSDTKIDATRWARTLNRALHDKHSPGSQATGRCSPRGALGELLQALRGSESRPAGRQPKWQTPQEARPELSIPVLCGRIAMGPSCNIISCYARHIQSCPPSDPLSTYQLQASPIVHSR